MTESSNQVPILSLREINDGPRLPDENKPSATTSKKSKSTYQKLQSWSKKYFGPLTTSNSVLNGSEEASSSHPTHTPGADLENSDPQLHIPKLSEPSSLLEPEDFAKLLNDGAPYRYKTQNLKLLYSTNRDGISLSTFYRNSSKIEPTLLVIQDEHGHVFGCYASSEWHSDLLDRSGHAYRTSPVVTPIVADSPDGVNLNSVSVRALADITMGIRNGMQYYGTGESFVFKAKPDYGVYKWARHNKYFQLSGDRFLAIGGGQGGGFAFWIDSDFHRGSSGDCVTFDSPVLASSSEFQCIVLELWALVLKF